MQALKRRLMALALASGTALSPFAATLVHAQDQSVQDPFAVEPVDPSPAVVDPAAAAAPVATEAAPVAEALPPAAADSGAAALRALLTAPDALAGVAAKDRAAILAWYGARAFEPMWVADGRLTERADAVVARIARAAEDGLDPSAYALPDAAALVGATPDRLAAVDVGLTAAVARFAREASGGRVSPQKISKDITRTPPAIDARTALATVEAATDVAAALDGFDPPHEEFRRLKAKLAEVRARQETPVAHAPIAEGPTLKPGMRDARVPALRERFGIPAPELVTGSLPETQTASNGDDELVATVEAALASSTDEVYDQPLIDAVKSFQAENGLTADGIVGARTLSVLNGGPRDEEGEIVANMEMWRWMPRDLGRDHVFVNVPEFMVHVVRDGVRIHETRVVVGKVTNQTPIFSDEMEYLVVNPYWNVPESIKIKEMLPAIKADPAGYMARHGYEVVWEGQVIDPATVVWDENAVKAVGIRQTPGEANALGHIKFMFPNQHAVYLHDTPSRALFQRDVRAFSHGCVRVDDPTAFAGAVLQGDPEWTVERVESLYGGPERRVNLAHHLKVHIAYFTASVDDTGKLTLRDDLYGHVRKLKAALGVST
ncbi:L,D-transpeptidase family protein [Oharaeibacter diazotrophicus]|uniref:Murein L,D-transpeptidase YcbB/YkuD n=2 Tax=Oharaeibacter diazotrophicus TaxID=1920512 RepID=A0A4R6RFP9_9HYPH|nr:L,D-transpeptidase family protein [Oharaeibacter diazotrophicus]TDP85072.1 murein L,D-transpeptidase YcbB/YkuD [Oharaeibacter diazotrophicus]BBE74042.1 murein L,D-transpeptidase [Pleomorphomonas sp. SM30]GLS76270.1 hypothetical protein GCM10007904_16050 [Oharaeibacter diazotrophicus]